jgi:hypothetical protein
MELMERTQDTSYMQTYNFSQINANIKFIMLTVCNKQKIKPTAKCKDKDKCLSAARSFLHLRTESLTVHDNTQQRRKIMQQHCFPDQATPPPNISKEALGAGLCVHYRPVEVASQL